MPRKTRSGSLVWLIEPAIRLWLVWLAAYHRSPSMWVVAALAAGSAWCFYRYIVVVGQDRYARAGWEAAWTSPPSAVGGTTTAGLRPSAVGLGAAAWSAARRLVTPSCAPTW